MRQGLHVALAVLALAVGSSTVASAQATKASGPHVIIVKMVEHGSGFAFDPSTITAQPGDTVRFVQASAQPHNVSFRKVPSGAKLGAAKVGPYVMASGESYDLVIDGRFVDGTYTFACDPHEPVGMTGTLIVGKPAQ